MNDRLIILMEALKGKHSIGSGQTTEMFAIHNHFFPNAMEHGKNCPSCRSRVYEKLKLMWNSL